MQVTKNKFFYLKIENIVSNAFEHGRPQWGLEYFKNKMIVYDINGNAINIEPDSIFIIPPDTYFKTESANGKPWTHTCITFDADEEYMKNLNLPAMTPIRIGKTKELEQLMFDMEDRQLSSSQFKQDAQDAYLLLILLTIYDYLNMPSKDYTLNAGDDLQKLRHTVMNSTGVFWTVESMAAQANMSVRGFQRKYKEMYGKSPIADLYDFRFVRAKRLLDTGYSINHILNSCGFRSPQHFSTFFKKRSGMTPTEYVKNKKK